MRPPFARGHAGTRAAIRADAAGGNIGVAIIQLVGPLAVTAGAIAVVGGSTGATEAGDVRFVQNAALVRLPFHRALRRPRSGELVRLPAARHADAAGGG